MKSKLESREVYISPLSQRYGSDEMRSLFSDRYRHRLWRMLWASLADAEAELGLGITLEQLLEMAENVDNIDYDKVAEYEAEMHHDVMAHLKEYCDKCKQASPIIHLGATSCYVTDNADLIIIDTAMSHIYFKVKDLMKSLYQFADKYKAMPTMAYTHLQPAQPTTVGKRACMWLQDLVMDFELINVTDTNKILGCNGATGTQASLVELFGKENAKNLNKMLSNVWTGEPNAYMMISGQTYTRKIDSCVLDVLSHIAETLYKMCNDIRLLQGMHEICEPFSSKQVGSSAMAYKQNPMKCENICSLTRQVISNTITAKNNVCNQWLERTLDDSGNRRIIISESFILIDHCLTEAKKIIDGLRVNEGIIQHNLIENVPFIAMESIIMEASKNGISRQDAHKRIRDLSVVATENMMKGGKNNLIDLIKRDAVLGGINIEIDINALTGLAEEQTTEYLNKIKLKYLLEDKK